MTSLVSKSFIASIAVSFLTTAASALVVERTVFTEPPCSVPFTPFLYAGCYTDPSVPRALPFEPAGYDTQHSTVEKCVAVCKGNGYRYAGLEYYGQCFCGDSIAGVATTPDQCTLPCSGDKTQTCGGNDNVSVYMDPTFPNTDANDISDYTPQGCYTESGNGRAVVYRQNQLSTATLTTEGCLAACKSQNYPLAATEYGQECYCGVVLGNGTASAPDSDCNLPCKGNSAEICGGRSRLNLYVAADLMSSEPCNPFVLPPPVISSTVTTSKSITSTPATTSLAQSTTSPTSSSSPTSSAQSTTPPAQPTTPPVPSSSASSTSSTAASSSSSSSSTLTSSTSSESSTLSTSSTSSESSTLSTSSTSSESSTLSTSSTSSKSSTSTTSTKCTSTAPAPTCEYACGSWCSKPLPTFTAQNECKIAVAECILQIADCFLTAGWPASLQCAKYQSWCSNIGTYCSNTCSGKSCSKSDCIGKNPPVAPAPVTTTQGVCSASTTTAKATTSTAAPIPTVSSICTLPNGPKDSGYESGSCVGDIQPPALTCNNLLSSFPQYPFKLYTDKDSKKCSGYSKSNVPQGCQDACQAQYESCTGTYAEKCKGQKKGHGQDDYDGAVKKCKNQNEDCLKANKGAAAGSRCYSFGSGWS